jgi:sec-independent protein translocase protein TatC
MNNENKKQKRFNRKEMPFLDHLEELRWRILKSLGSVVLFTMCTFPFTGILLTFLTYPNNRLKEPAELIFLKPTGMLMVRLEIAVAVGIIVSLPVIFYQFWQFIAPGLLPKERRYFLPTLFFTTFCFIAGTAFAYMILIPIILPFLFSMGTDAIKPTINITEYMSFVIRLILISGLIFELPILSFVLSVTGLVRPKILKKYRKYSIVIIFIVAAILTPPDPLSQLLMAFPLIILYEVSIWVSYLGYRKKKAKDDAWEKEFNSTAPVDKQKKAAD